MAQADPELMATLLSVVIISVSHHTQLRNVLGVRSYVLTRPMMAGALSHSPLCFLSQELLTHNLAQRLARRACQQIPRTSSLYFAVLLRLQAPPPAAVLFFFF